MKFFRLMILICFLIATQRSHANSGAWTNPTGGDWNTDGNWISTHPDAIDAVAGFIGFPTSAGTITSTSDITIGSLVFDTTTTLSINLSHNLTFSRVFGNSQIFSSSGSITNNIITSLTPLILNSNLDIFLNNEINLFIQSSISGSGSLTLYGGSNIFSTDVLHLSGNNSYTAGTFISTGILSVEGADNTTVIPGDITVTTAGGSITHTNDNHYSPSTTMTVNSGFVDLNGTNQTMEKVTFIGGLLFDSANSGILDLLALPGDAALTIGDNAQINPFQINLDNGGGIFYDATHSGTAFIPGPTTIDLQGHSIDFHVPHVSFNCIDVDIGITVFQNGTLNKTQDGVVKFQGGTVPTFNIQDGTVVIGDESPPEVVTATGVVTVTSPGILAGFQTLDAQAGVVNSGTISPGNACSGCSTVGTLTIQGNHQQSSSGTLEIKALNQSTSDLLVVNGGTVNLNGELSFDSVAGAVFHPGDQILILDNTNESTPITGTFSTFSYNLPPCLQASILYQPHQVFVRISSCPCPASPFPPSNFVGRIKKCKFLNKKECSLEATWNASPSINVVFYRIYKHGKVVETVLATDPLVFKVKHLKDCSVEGYAIAAVDSNGVESAHIKLRRIDE